MALLGTYTELDTNVIFVPGMYTNPHKIWTKEKSTIISHNIITSQWTS